jgi:hypothetical protein
MRIALAAIAAVVLSMTLTSAQDKKPSSGEWRSLFDGKTTNGWRGFRHKTMPDGWQVVDGALTRVSKSTDIVTIDEFGDFELMLEWNLPPNGNSGIHYRVIEDDDVMWHQAPEYQIIDNAYKEPLKPGQYTGANYDLHPPSRDVTRPIGSWNVTRLIVRGAHVEHWLNGVKVVEYERGTQLFRALVNNSKYMDFPGFGERERGPILLQDHGNAVSFRSIKIRSL